MGVGCVVWHCAYELIFAGAPLWLRIGMINFTCTAKAAAGALEAACDSVIPGSVPCQARRFHTKCDRAWSAKLPAGTPRGAQDGEGPETASRMIGAGRTAL